MLANDSRSELDETSRVFHASRSMRADLPFSEQELLRVLEPLDRATTLPRAAYLDPVVLELEREVIFRRAWLCVGREAEVADPGQWLRADVVPEGVIVARGEDGVLRGFFNVCRHRGATLVEAECGKASRFVCKYHGWRYALDGGLEHAPHTARLAAFDAGDHGLAPVQVDVWNGFVFLTLDPSAPPLQEWLGEIPVHFRAADVAVLRSGRRVQWEVAANWKLLIENYQESHHFPGVHPELEGHTPFSHSSSFHSDGSRWLGGVMDLVDGAETVSLDGRLHGRARIRGADPERVVDCMLWPNLLTSLQPDYLLTYRLTPLAPDRTRIVAEILFPPESITADFAPTDVFDFWDVTNRQDKEICERQQLGIASSSYVQGRYAEVEDGMHAFDKRVARAYLDDDDDDDEREPELGNLCGIWSRPYIDLEPFFDLSQLSEIHEEICRGLCDVETSYTGGSLKWMEVAAPWVMDDGYADLGSVIERMTRSEFARFVELADDPTVFDLGRKSEYRFGDETEHPLNRRQMQYLKYRYGVYFPWKVVYHLLENEKWEDKHSGTDKDFEPEAREIFPKTVRFIENLPFTEIGRCLIFGLEANDHATLHRDSEPGRELSIAQSITISPAGNKRFYLCDAEGESYTPVKRRMYWFNDMDYHGVEPDPFFRYSIRVDGVFERSFLERIQRTLRRG